jgi:predicted dehydrogenase
MEAKKVNWGIISTGEIAQTLASAMQVSHTGQLVAVASRDTAKAKAFAEKHGSGRCTPYGSYEAMLADPNVRAVYIATPHPSHATWAVKAAEAGKHVLVEKPMAMNLQQAKAIVEAARRKRVFLMEAFMYRCHPLLHKLADLLKEGVIGQLQLIQASFCYRAAFNAKARQFDKALGGGGILDVGCYPASLARRLAGAVVGKEFVDPIEVKAMGHLEETGADGYAIAMLRFPNDVMAQITCGVALAQERALRVYGTDGFIVVPNPWMSNRSGPDKGTIVVHKKGEPKPLEFILEPTVSSFALEVDVAGEAIASGASQVSAMNWDDSLGNIAVLDAWRREIGVAYDGE